MGMPQYNKEDPWTIRRIHIICTIWAVIYLAATSPIYFIEVSVLGIGLWSVAAGWGGIYIALQAARPDWRCALPQPLRAFFFRSLAHPWAETRRVDWYVEQYCEKCQTYRHGRMTAYDAVEEWKEGRLPGASVPLL
jgi:hypothetical protein